MPTFNPAVTLADASQGGISFGDALAYLAAQVLGAFVGVAAAHLMFGEALLQMSHHARTGGGQLFSEFVATFGLLCVIWGCARLRSETVPMAVGLYITGAYWFTASTSFANPAVTLARAFTDTFAGIRPLDAAGSVVPQFLGAENRHGHEVNRSSLKTPTPYAPSIEQRMADSDIAMDFSRLFRKVVADRADLVAAVRPTQKTYKTTR